jgi:hypothetical protein
MAGDHSVHPDDHSQMDEMTTEFVSGRASGVLRMTAVGGGWTPVHVTVNRIELEEDIFAGLISLRPPTADELTADTGEPAVPKRKARSPKGKAPKA